MGYKIYIRQIDLKRLDKEIIEILFIVKDISIKYNKKIFLVGGQVRDILLGEKSKDLDFVVLDDGIDFAKKLQEKIGGKVKTYKNFMSSTIILNNGINIDITTSRKEIYEKPGCLPLVTKGSIIDDIMRRDFTINCLLLNITKLPNIEVLDYVGGISDLEHRRIRILHNKSFVDDPTRMIRAVRLSCKLGFDIEENTEELLIDSIGRGFIKFVSDDRIFKEIEKILLMPKKKAESMKMLYNYNLFRNTFLNKLIVNQVIIYLDIFEKYFSSLIFKYHLSDEAIYTINLMILFHKTNLYTLIEIIKNLKIKREIKRKIINIKQNYFLVKNLIYNDISLGIIYKILDLVGIEGLMYLAVINYKNNLFLKKLDEYSDIYNRLEIFVSGKDIEEYGIKPGPMYKKIKEMLILKIINQKAYKKEEQLKILSEIINKKESWENNEFSPEFNNNCDQ